MEIERPHLSQGGQNQLSGWESPQAALPKETDRDFCTGITMSTNALANDIPVLPASVPTSATAIALCGLAMIFEGFDTYAISYAGPVMAKQWALSQSVVGQMYAAGVAASLLGSIAFGLLADRHGRKRLLVLATITFGLATLMGAMAPSIGVLILSRVLNGIGLGASIPCAMALAAEAARPAYRAAVPVLMAAAIGTGQIVASLAAAVIMPDHGWRGLLFLGALLPVLLAPLMAYFLVETPMLSSLKEKRAPWYALFSPDVAPSTLLLIGALFATYVVTFFFGFWLPSLLQTVTPDITKVGFAMTLIKSCSLAGSLLVAWLVTVYGMRRILPLTFLLAALGLVLFVGRGQTLIGMTAALAFASFFVDGAFSGIIGLGAAVFPAHLRASGIGVSIGIGRLVGGTAGPMLGGLLLDRHASLSTIGLVFAVPLMAAALLSLLVLSLPARRDAA